MNDNPATPRTAVALTYDQKRAPYLSAKGKGLVAEEIIRIAAEHGIFIHEDPALVEMLALLQLGQDIPESLYKAIAEVIAFAYSLRSDNPVNDPTSTQPHL
ncbi:MAG: EscU/YscU/HrcU family type III secretion system export apparatus switch protein [Motiliproteus sp.]